MIIDNKLTEYKNISPPCFFVQLYSLILYSHNKKLLAKDVCLPQGKSDFVDNLLR